MLTTCAFCLWCHANQTPSTLDVWASSPSGDVSIFAGRRDYLLRMPHLPSIRFSRHTIDFHASPSCDLLTFAVSRGYLQIICCVRHTKVFVMLTCETFQVLGARCRHTTECHTCKRAAVARHNSTTVPQYRCVMCSWHLLRQPVVYFRRTLPTGCAVGSAPRLSRPT